MHLLVGPCISIFALLMIFSKPLFPIIPTPALSSIFFMADLNKIIVPHPDKYLNVSSLYQKGNNPISGVLIITKHQIETVAGIIKGLA